MSMCLVTSGQGNRPPTSYFDTVVFPQVDVHLTGRVAPIRHARRRDVGLAVPRVRRHLRASHLAWSRPLHARVQGVAESHRYLLVPPFLPTESLRPRPNRSWIRRRPSAESMEAEIRTGYCEHHWRQWWLCFYAVSHPVEMRDRAPSRRPASRGKHRCASCVSADGLMAYEGSRENTRFASVRSGRSVHVVLDTWQPTVAERSVANVPRKHWQHSHAERF